MRQPFYKDNRIVPLGIMLLTFFIFVYHFELDRPVPLGEIPATIIPNTFIESSRQGNANPTAKLLISPFTMSIPPPFPPLGRRLHLPR